MYPLIPIYEQCMEKKKLKRRVVGYERERKGGRGGLVINGWEKR